MKNKLFINPKGKYSNSVILDVKRLLRPKERDSFFKAIQPNIGRRLKEFGISSSENLIKMGATPKGRELISQGTGLSNHQVLDCVKRADLFRIKGLSSEYLDLLNAAGINSVEDLSGLDSKKLLKKMEEANLQKKIVRRLPGEQKVGEWVSAVRKTKTIVQY